MAEDGKKPWFRNQFRDWVEGNLKESFDSLHDVRRSKLMARFFAEQVLRPRYPTLLPFAEEELRACVVDGAGDCGVDFVSREEGTVLVIQAKYSGGKKAAKRPHEEPADFQSFRTVLERLRRFRERRMAEALKEIAADIDWETDKFQLYYITLRQPYENQEIEAADGVPPMADVPDLQDRVELVFCDENRLNHELRDALSVDELEGKTFRLQFSHNENGAAAWLKLGGGETRPCFVGRISGAQLAVLFQQHKSSLFTLNIRNYIGDNGTNKAIRTTALERSSDFFSFNNGISALATRITPDQHDPRVLICERLSIINGAQTIRSLHKAHVVNSAALRDVHVLLRITQFDAKKTQAEQEFLDNVTKYNNTQNAIKLSDFRSNDRVQLDLRRKFDQLPSLGGRKFSYKNKRSGERERDVIAIGMEEFVKTLYAFSYGPDDVYGGTGHVFDATKGGGYAKLFGEGGEILPAIPAERFYVYAGVWFLCEEAKRIGRERSREGNEPGIERRWMFYYALGESIRLSHTEQGVDPDSALRPLSNPAWLKQGEDGPIMKVISRHCKVAFRALIASYKEASRDPGFAHRNWFRSQATLGSIKEHLTEDWSLLAEHGDEYLFPTRKDH